MDNFNVLRNYKQTTPLVQDTSCTRCRRKHRKLALAIAKLVENQYQDGCAISKIAELHQCVHDLTSLTLLPFRQFSNATLLGLAEACFSEKPIEFVTIASGAVIGESFDIHLANKRIQYLLYDSIKKNLEEVFALKNVKWNYTVLLPLSASFNKQNKSWQENKQYIESCTKVPVLYPSDFFDDFSGLYASVHAKVTAGIHSKTEELLKHPTIQGQFAVTEDKIKSDVRDYALYGLLFEQTAKPIILIDLQGKIYPYQQPYYSMLRTKPLPLLPMQHLVAKMEKGLH